MGRTTSITDDIILKAAFNILIREGFQAVNIKTIAKEINCSTQPVSWHFGNMEGLRKALWDYAAKYEGQRVMSVQNDSIDAFWHIGRAYVDLAFEMPNLFRFLYMDEEGHLRGGINVISGISENKLLLTKLSGEYGCCEADVATFIEDTIIYTHGLSCLIVAGVLSATKEEVYDRIRKAGENLLFTLQEKNR